jgi:hypothetical protein
VCRGDAPPRGGGSKAAARLRQQEQQQEQQMAAPDAASAAQLARNSFQQLLQLVSELCAEAKQQHMRLSGTAPRSTGQVAELALPAEPFQDRHVQQLLRPQPVPDLHAATELLAQLLPYLSNAQASHIAELVASCLGPCRAPSTAAFLLQVASRKAGCEQWASWALPLLTSARVGSYPAAAEKVWRDAVALAQRHFAVAAAALSRSALGVHPHCQLLWRQHLELQQLLGEWCLAVQALVHACLCCMTLHDAALLAAEGWLQAACDVEAHIASYCIIMPCMAGLQHTALVMPYGMMHTALH